MRWTVRLPHGKPLGIVTASNIDVALTLARSKHRIHDVSVDNLEPLGGPPTKAKIRYLDEQRNPTTLGKVLGRWWNPHGR